MKKIVGIFVSAVVMLSFCTPVYAAHSKKIDVLLNNSSISVEGEEIAKAGESYTLVNGAKVPYSINYAGTIYLPMRKVAELLNKDVEYSMETKTANITAKPGSELLPPITVYTELTYDVNGTPELNFVLYNLSDKDIESYSIMVYCYDKDWIPIIKKNTKSNFLYFGGDNILIKGNEIAEKYIMLEGLNGTEAYDLVVQEVIFTDGTAWYR
ncbi:hypothetical protein [Anaerotignum sp. MB30-C6]|uniref:hypothetical protein n=1 Tax=Anaerotignum sp. MB30-C6 TaxID=3070814 RepID=UPI0027DE7BD3|nr:hypothetical protein [Anaerotignum sp. MB30-C6]WMI81074.1 hypothetical protein RBQ60_14890 [Anaerotignum sp. MB30-C6]